MCAIEVCGEWKNSALAAGQAPVRSLALKISVIFGHTDKSRGAATDSGPPGQHIHSGPPAFRGIYIIEIAIAFPSQSFFPLLPNQIILFQLLKSFSFCM